MTLEPRSLARKRLWNKKYPICVELAHQEDFMSKAQVDKNSSEEKVDGSSQDGGKLLCNREEVLYLFGRTGREKEEWFHRFLLASKMKTEPKKSGGTPAIKAGNLFCLRYSSFNIRRPPPLYCQPLFCLLRSPVGGPDTQPE